MVGAAPKKGLGDIFRALKTGFASGHLARSAPESNVPRWTDPRA